MVRSAVSAKPVRTKRSQASRAAPARLFAFIDDVGARFAHLDDFEPAFFVADAFPPRLESSVPCVTRSFRYDGEGASTQVRIYGGPRTNWLRETVKQFVRAGYVCRWRFDDETICHRGLTGSAAYRSELALLREMTEAATPGRWPVRSPRAIHVPRRKRNLSRGWSTALATARSAGITWTDLAVGFWRTAPLVIDGARFPLRVTLGAAADACIDGRRSVVVDISVTDPRGMKTALPPTLGKALRRMLLDRGYQTYRVQSPRVAGSILMFRRMGHPRDAARECLDLGVALTA